MLSSRGIVPARFGRNTKLLPNGCIEWTARRSPQGYGHVQLSKPRRTVRAHRWSWEIHNGAIPDGMMVLHRCDNPPCVNPEHLFIGTGSDNIRDRHNKRIARGEAVPNATLTPEQVRVIKARLRDGDSTYAIARDYGMVHNAIWQIKSGKTWGWV